MILRLHPTPAALAGGCFPVSVDGSLEGVKLERLCHLARARFGNVRADLRSRESLRVAT